MSEDMAKRPSKREFFEIFNDPDRPRSATAGKADWDEIFAELSLLTEPVDIKTIHTYYVKGAVKRYRTKVVLQQWATQDKCKMIWHKGRYWFYFGNTPRKTRKPKAE